MGQVNRIIYVLAKKQKTNKWYVGQAIKDNTTIPKWCTNCSRSSIVIFLNIAYNRRYYSTCFHWYCRSECLCIRFRTW